MVFEARGPSNVHVWSSRAPIVHIRGSRRFKHHQNSTRRPPGEKEKKNENAGGRGKKARNFGPPTLRGLTLPGPSSMFFVPFVTFYLVLFFFVPFVTIYLVPNAVFFAPFVFFLSRMHLFILSRRPLAYFVPIPFFCPVAFFCPNTVDNTKDAHFAEVRCTTVARDAFQLTRPFQLTRSALDTL